MAEVGKWLKSVVQGYFNYYTVPGNMDSLNSFRAQLICAGTERCHGGASETR